MSVDPSCPPVRVALGGKARAGKSTAAELLCNCYGGSILNFSEPLYDIMHYAEDRVGLPRDKDRAFLQYIGTSWGRGREPDLWVRLMLETVGRLPPAMHVFVGDVRFPNEMSALRDAGFIMIKVTRPGAGLPGEEGMHASETALDSAEWDGVVDNSGSREDLLAALIAVVDKKRSG